MSIEVHLDWEGSSHLVGVLHSATRGSSVTFEYGTEWLARPKAFAIDPTNLPLRPGPHHRTALFGALQDCGPDRWGRVLIERAVRRHVLESKPFRDLDYVLALTLAEKAGIRVAEHRLVNSKGRGVSVITRFDRDGANRIPFLSANSLLGFSQGEPGAYTMLAEGIRQFGDDVRDDLQELWRRLVFSLLASNYDDHLRNHGFLMRTAGRWSLSPAYDLNPVPEIDRAQTPKTAVTEEQDSPSVAVALDAAPRFGLRGPEAKAILREVMKAVLDWRKTAGQLRMSAGSISAYASAFEHPLIQEASKLAG